MIRRAYAIAVEQLRHDPHYPLLVPTLFEVAAQYRRLVPGTALEEIRTQILAANLKLADWGSVAATTSGIRALVA